MHLDAFPPPLAVAVNASGRNKDIDIKEVFYVLLQMFGNLSFLIATPTNENSFPSQGIVISCTHVLYINKNQAKSKNFITIIFFF